MSYRLPISTQTGQVRTERTPLNDTYSSQSTRMMRRVHLADSDLELAERALRALAHRYRRALELWGRLRRPFSSF